MCPIILLILYFMVVLIYQYKIIKANIVEIDFVLFSLFYIKQQIIVYNLNIFYYFIIKKFII